MALRDVGSGHGGVGLDLRSFGKEMFSNLNDSVMPCKITSQGAQGEGVVMGTPAGPGTD